MASWYRLTFLLRSASIPRLAEIAVLKTITSGRRRSPFADDSRTPRSNHPYAEAPTTTIEGDSCFAPRSVHPDRHVQSAVKKLGPIVMVSLRMPNDDVGDLRPWQRYRQESVWQAQNGCAALALALAKMWWYPGLLPTGQPWFKRTRPSTLGTDNERICPTCATETRTRFRLAT